MKTVNINKRRKDKSPREICLGNGKRISFKSARLANKFIAETNRYLTKALVNFNEIYVQLFTEYRRMWFITVNTNAGTRTNYHAVEYSIKKALESADFMFNKFSSTTWGSNDPFFAFVDLKKIGLFLQDAADELEAFHRGRDNTANYYTCMLLKERCLSVVQKLETYDYPQQKALR